MDRPSFCAESSERSSRLQILGGSDPRTAFGGSGADPAKAVGAASVLRAGSQTAENDRERKRSGRPGRRGADMNDHEHAIEQYENGDFAEALESFRALSALSGNDTERLNYIGRCLTELGEWDEAAAIFDEAIRSQPEWERPYFNKAFVRLKQGRKDEAEWWARRAVKIDEDSEDAWYYLGLIFEKQGKKAAAKKCYKKSLLLEPEQEEPYINLGGLYWEERQWDRSMEQFRQALRVNPGCGDALYNMALLHLDMNHLNESRELLKQLLESNPDDREAAEKLKEISIDTKGDSP
ncbi:hypothetical protein CDO73_08535 [Saccharibacillus sp. O23]|nr:hypothetical protein CDO73_08535 [Saccharibacillus sp. O23]